MSKSLWSILILGVLTAMILSLFMLLTLDTYQQTPAGNRFKLAESIRTEYTFDSAGADVSPIDGKMVLRISYLTTRSSSHNADVQKKEMESVAAFAASKYDGKDRGAIQEIRVQRTELRGRGCFQKTYKNNHSTAAPAEWRGRPGLPGTNPFLQPPTPPAPEPSRN